MAKRLIKKTKTQTKKVVSHRSLSTWKVFWLSFTTFAIVLTILTTANIYFANLKANTVLGTSTYNPCLNTHCGPGNYCGGRCGLKGDPRFLYTCACKPGQKTCSNAPVYYKTINNKPNPNTCQYKGTYLGCQYHTNAPDECKKPSAAILKPNTISVNSILQKLSSSVEIYRTCNSHEKKAFLVIKWQAAPIAITLNLLNERTFQRKIISYSSTSSQAKSGIFMTLFSQIFPVQDKDYIRLMITGSVPNGRGVTQKSVITGFEYRNCNFTR